MEACQQPKESRQVFLRALIGAGEVNFDQRLIALAAKPRCGERWTGKEHVHTCSRATGHAKGSCKCNCGTAKR